MIFGVYQTCIYSSPIYATDFIHSISLYRANVCPVSVQEGLSEEELQALETLFDHLQMEGDIPVAF